ncbi:hypothetical protein B0H19DRAFT_1265720 [Mycena capillaripes]|nr:hypothetical protein B0H19DRAFT_1265720 [Mycena capillaripes]
MLISTQIIGYFLNWGLLGTLTLQLYLYYQAFPNDQTFTKCLVYSVYMIVLVQTALMTVDAITIFVAHYGVPFDILDSPGNKGFEWFWLPIMSSLVAFIGQSFYAYRIYVLSKSWKMPLFIVTVSMSANPDNFSNIYHLVAPFLSLYGPMTNISGAKVALVGFALSDIIITTCLTYYLLKSDTGFRRTHALILRLIWRTIETGCVTTVMALLTLLLVLTFPNKSYYFTPAVVVPMAYANTLFAVLNSRFQILGGRGYTPSQDIISTPSFLVHDRGGGGPNPSVQSPFITIDREVLDSRELADLAKARVISRHGAGTPI